MVTDRAVAAGAGSTSREDGGGDKLEHEVDGGEVPSLIQAPASELGSYPRSESYSENKILDINKGIPVDLATKRALQELTLHGHPVTIAKCKFQAHIARVNTAAEARAVSEAVSAQTQCEAAFSEFVCPFAYRLACLRGPDPRGGNDRSPAAAPDTEEEEGYCDNGDIGSGEKLLYLLQKWDVRHRVLVVTRINGGFMMAELLGVRRYKFVIDRAKRLLENSDLASLRRAVDVDMNPPSTTAENAKILAIYEAAAGGSQFPPQSYCRAGDGGIAGEDGWDRFVVPLSARRRISGHGRFGNPTGAPRDSGSVIDPRQQKFNGSLGRGKLQSAVIEDGLPRVNSQQGVGWGDGGSIRTRERRALSLAQLSISSKTVAFPPGHVPSVMGAKGQGKKRGRINHFAVRTPPSTSGGCGQCYAIEDSCDVDRNADSDASSSDQRRIGLTPRWNLPHELDPTSGTTGLGGGRGTRTAATQRGGNRARGLSRSTFERVQDSSSAALASRSSCGTINSPGRISAIMLGVVPGISNDHPLHPPPPDVAAKSCQFRASSGASRLPATIYDGVVRSHGGTSDASASSCGLGYRRQPPPGTNAPASHADGARARASLRRPLGGGGGGGGNFADAGHAAPFSGIIDDQDFTRNGAGSCRPAGGPGGSVGRVDYDNNINNSNAGLPLPLLRETPGTGVREQPWEVADGALEPNASVGGWKDDSDDLSISTLGDGDGEGDQERVQAVGDSLGEIRRAGERERREKQCESPGWSSGDPIPQGRTPSGDPRAPPSSSMSGVRGWSVGRAAPVSQPLVTELRTAPSPGRYTVSPR